MLEADFEGAIEEFYKFFGKDRLPAGMMSASKFLEKECLGMIDGVAYKRRELC